MWSTNSHHRIFIEKTRRKEKFVRLRTTSLQDYSQQIMCFPLDFWDLLLPQATTTLNLLQNSRIFSKLSVCAVLEGQHDFNCHPLTPPGTKIVVHEKNGRAEKANGHLSENIEIDVIPTLNEIEALEQALFHIDATAYAWESESMERALQIYKNDAEAFNTNYL